MDNGIFVAMGALQCFIWLWWTTPNPRNMVHCLACGLSWILYQQLVVLVPFCLYIPSTRLGEALGLGPWLATMVWNRYPEQLGHHAIVMLACATLFWISMQVKRLLSDKKLEVYSWSER